MDKSMAQRQSGNAEYLDIPSWRLPKDMSTLVATDAFIQKRFFEEFNMRVTLAKFIGGSYYPSPGTSPEAVVIVAVTVEAYKENPKLIFVALQELIDGRRMLRDGHLLITIFRVAHCLGLLKTS